MIIHNIELRKKHNLEVKQNIKTCLKKKLKGKGKERKFNAYIPIQAKRLS